MMVIILMSFANLFFILNNNTKTEDNHYVKKFTGNSLIDAVINSYLMGLGNFNMDGYSSGPNVSLMWTAFCIGSFLVVVVFMNMLIAIMSDTFG